MQTLGKKVINNFGTVVTLSYESKNKVQRMIPIGSKKLSP